jgi:hypothetical protein
LEGLRLAFGLGKTLAFGLGKALAFGLARLKFILLFVLDY